jgi:hypothetical protein
MSLPEGGQEDRGKAAEGAAEVAGQRVGQWGLRRVRGWGM